MEGQAMKPKKCSNCRAGFPCKTYPIACEDLINIYENGVAEGYRLIADQRQRLEAELNEARTVAAQACVDATQYRAERDVLAARLAECVRAVRKWVLDTADASIDEVFDILDKYKPEGEP
jgi:hypothetical protein